MSPVVKSREIHWIKYSSNHYAACGRTVTSVDRQHKTDIATKVTCPLCLEWMVKWNVVSQDVASRQVRK